MAQIVQGCVGEGRANMVFRDGSGCRFVSAWLGVGENESPEVVSVKACSAFAAFF